MVRVSNFIVGVVNALSLVLGLAAAGAGVYFLVHGASTQCQQSLTEPLLITGALVFLFSIMGLVGACCKNNVVMFVYLAVMLILLVGIVGFTVFVFLVTNKGAGKVVSDKGFKQYRTGDYAHWLERHFVNEKKWDRIRSCLVESHICKSLGNQNGPDFFKNSLTSLQSGCCKPPSECGFQFKNATYWEVEGSGPSSNNTDCQTWGNNGDKLCYDCNSCKTGFLANIRNQWKHLLLFNICLIIVLILVYSVGCCAMKSNRRDSRKYRGMP